jgi:hypothetical protein
MTVHALRRLPPDLLQDHVARLYSHRSGMKKRLGLLRDAKTDAQMASRLARQRHEQVDAIYNLACIEAMLRNRDAAIGLSLITDSFRLGSPTSPNSTVSAPCGSSANVTGRERRSRCGWSGMVRMGCRKIAITSVAALVAVAAVAAMRRRADWPPALFMPPESSGKASPTPPPAGSKRPQWKKYRPSLILGPLGFAMLLVGFLFYPSVAELPTPGYSQLIIKSNTPIGAIQYGVAQISGVAAEITVRVSLDPGAPSGTATLSLLLPFGDTFINCRVPNCHATTPAGSYWSKQLTLRSNGGSILAIPHIFVRASHFGEISNGVTASAVIPEVDYNGPPAPLAALLAGYKIPSGRSYDWSSFQPQSFTKGFVVWAENFSVGDTQSRVAVGINHNAQTNDDFMIFLAGAVVALAGAAILAAIQEALIPRDRDS